MNALLNPVLWTMDWFESLPHWLQVLLAVIGGIVLFILVYWTFSHDTKTV